MVMLAGERHVRGDDTFGVFSGKESSLAFRAVQCEIRQELLHSKRIVPGTESSASLPIVPRYDDHLGLQAVRLPRPPTQCERASHL